MLVLSRKQNGRIDLLIQCCGGYEPLGTVIVNKIEGNRVSLGLELRKDVLIKRAELDDKPKESEAAA